MVLYNAMRKHGFDAFTIEHVASAKDYASLQALEIELIAQYDTRVPRGYNVALGGNLGRTGLKNSPEHNAIISKCSRGRTYSPETIARMSRGQKARHAAKPQKGFSPTPETRAKISQSLKGRKVPPEQLAKFSASRKGRPHTDAHSQAISESKLLRWANGEPKYIAGCFLLLAGAQSNRVAEWLQVSVPAVARWKRVHLTRAARTEMFDAT